MEKRTFSSIDGQREQLEAKLVEALFRNDTKRIDQITARLIQGARLRLVPVGLGNKDN